MVSLTALEGGPEPCGHPVCFFPGSKYYEKEALLADPVFGPILASLLGKPGIREACAGPQRWLRGRCQGTTPELMVPVSTVGPCALEYTKLKTADHYWTDPSADELVQRHRIRGPPHRQDSPAKRPALGVGVPLPTPCSPRMGPWACGEGSQPVCSWQIQAVAASPGEPSPHWLLNKCQEHRAGPRPRANWGQEGLSGSLAPTLISLDRGPSHDFVRRSASDTQAAVRRRTGLPPAPASTWSRCTRTPGPGCSTARTTCWCSR